MEKAGYNPIHDIRGINVMKICDYKTLVLLFSLTGLWLTGCTPTVKVEAPEKPIEINMHVKIEHEIRVKVEKDIDELLTQQPGLF